MGRGHVLNSVFISGCGATAARGTGGHAPVLPSVVTSMVSGDHGRILSPGMSRYATMLTVLATLTFSRGLGPTAAHGTGERLMLLNGGPTIKLARGLSDGFPASTYMSPYRWC